MVYSLLSQHASISRYSCERAMVEHSLSLGILPRLSVLICLLATPSPRRSYNSYSLDGLGGRGSGPWGLGAQRTGATLSPVPMSSYHLLASSMVRSWICHFLAMQP